MEQISKSYQLYLAPTTILHFFYNHVLCVVSTHRDEADTFSYICKRGQVNSGYLRSKVYVLLHFGAFESC